MKIKKTDRVAALPFPFAFMLRLSCKKSDRSVVLKIDALTDRKTFPTNGVAYSPGEFISIRLDHMSRIIINNLSTERK